MAANNEGPGRVPLLACAEGGQSGGLESLLAGIIAPSIWEWLPSKLPKKKKKVNIESVDIGLPAKRQAAPILSLGGDEREKGH